LQAQKENTNLADAAESWSKLQNNLPESISRSEYYLKQQELGLTGLAAAANILHPGYKGMQRRLCLK
jgi:hypothetical protein